MKFFPKIHFLLLSGFSLACLLARGNAQTASWAVSSGTWNVPGNWSGASIPVVSGTAYIDNTGTAILAAGVSGTAGSVFIGNSGTGSVGISGGNLTGTNGYLGYNAGSLGSAIVSSGTWSESGTIAVGQGGAGSLSITGGYVSDSTGYVGRNAGSNGTATVSSGTWSSTNLYIGNSGTGTLTINGGSLSASSSFIGNGAGSSGTANIISGNWNQSGTISVAQSGVGALNISGGTVSDASTSIGVNAGSNGTVTMSSGTWTNTNNLFVGNSGTGTLIINGGVVSGSYASYVGYNAGSSGTASLLGGVWNNPGLFYVGYSGTGALTINGGSLNTTAAASYVGYNVGSLATATVTSGSWNAAGNNINVGFFGTGTLNINGGYVATSGVFIGDTAGSNGTVTVSSGTWNNTLYDFVVGNSGTGTLNITGNGTVIVGTGDTLYLADNGAMGTLNMGTGGLSGTLNARTVAAGSGTGVVNFNETNAIAFSTSISGGSMRVNQIGSGTTTLSGRDTYSGVTSITAGTLEFAKEASLYNGGTASWTAAHIIVASGATMGFNVSGTGDFTASDLGTLLALGSGSNGFENGSSVALNTADGNFTYGGNITNTNGGANMLGLTKLGANTLTLTGSNTYTGPTIVSGGTLVFAGSLSGTNNIMVNAGASLGVSGTINEGSVTVSGTLGGSGVVNAPVTVSAGGSTFPGMSGTAAKLTTDLAYSGSSSAQFMINSTTTPNGLQKVTAGTDYDQIIVTGSSNPTLTIAANVTLQLNLTAGALNVLHTNAATGSNPYSSTGSNTGQYNYFVFSLGSGTSSGEFTTLTLDINSILYSGVISYSTTNSDPSTGGNRFLSSTIGDVTINGIAGSVTSQEFAISYTGNMAANSTTGGNDIVLTAVPEPNTALLLGCGLSLMAFAKLRRSPRSQPPR